MEIKIRTKQRNYSIYLEHGILNQAASLIGTEGRQFIITDSGVPLAWTVSVRNQFPECVEYVIPYGEQSKSLEMYQKLMNWLVTNKCSRKDTIIAIGGGVVGDLSGFVASTYMRGIRYVNIPTTVLSQIDSSIGGKTAIDFNGLKNIVGSFWQPSMVLIDPDTLLTLSARHLSNGFAEAVKAGLIRDRELFELFEKDDYLKHVDEIIYRSLMVKKTIVEEDETEQSVRKLLNFGHTFGHGYESYFEGRYLHGECVAMGMMTILKNEEIKERLRRVLIRLNLPFECECDKNRVAEIITSDKKAAGNRIDIVQVDEIGNGHVETWPIDEIRRLLG